MKVRRDEIAYPVRSRCSCAARTCWKETCVAGKEVERVRPSLDLVPACRRTDFSILASLLLVVQLRSGQLVSVVLKVAVDSSRMLRLMLCPYHVFHRRAFLFLSMPKLLRVLAVKCLLAKVTDPVWSHVS